MAKNKKVVSVDENNVTVEKTYEKIHLGNVKLSESKKAVKVHIFNGEKKYVIPLKELSENTTVGRVYEYLNGKPEIVGEIFKETKQSSFYTLNIGDNIFNIKNNYVKLLLNNTNLTLPIYDED